MDDGSEKDVDLDYINGRIKTYRRRVKLAVKEKSKKNRKNKLDYWLKKKKELLKKQGRGL